MASRASFHGTAAGRVFARAALVCLVASAPTPVDAAEGTLPNRSYTPDQLFQVISPQMSEVHHNQSHPINGYVFLGGNAIHEIWDIADPFHPQKLAELESPHAKGEAESHTLSFAKYADGKLYAATISGRGIDLWDVSDARAPRLVKVLELEGIDYGDNTEAVWGVFWQGKYVYVGGTTTGLHVVDASDPAQAFVVRRVPTTELGGVVAGPVFACGNLLVVTTPKDMAGIATLDIGDPDEPKLLDAVLPPQASYIGWFYGAHAFLQMPLRVYDVTSNPSEITLIGSTETESSEYMNFANGQLFLGMRRPKPGISLFNLEEIGAPRLIGNVPGRDVVLADDQFTVPLGNLLIMSDDERNIGSVVAVHDTRPDSFAPTVLYVNPINEATGQPLTTRVGLSFDDQIDLTSVDPSTLIVRPLGGAALAGRWGNAHTHIAFWPDAPLAPNTTYEIVLPAGGIADPVGNKIARTFRSVFSTGSAIQGPSCAITAPEPVPIGQAVTFEADRTKPSWTYAWDFGDGTSASTSQSSGAAHTYSAPGRYPVKLTVTDATGSTSCSALHVAHRPLPNGRSTRSSSVIFDEQRRSVWVVNPDADTVTGVSADSLSVLAEVEVGDEPSALALSPDGSLWVTNRGSATIVVLDAGDGERQATIALPRGSMPHGIAFSPDGRAAYVALEATGQLAELDPERREIRRVLDLAGAGAAVVPKVRGVAVTQDSARVLVTRFVSSVEQAEVYAVDAATLELTDTFVLAKDPGPDDKDAGRGVPNYVSSIVISPDGARAFVPSKKDNVERGISRDGLALTTDNTVRTIVSQIDLTRGSEDLSARVDLDDHDMAFAAETSPVGDLVFVVSQGTNRVDVLDAYAGATVAGFATGLAPQGLALSSRGELFVQSFLSRSLSGFDVAAILSGSDTTARKLGEVSTVSAEPLTPEILLGKQIFYNGGSRQMSQDGYVSCASCHLDGGEDGRVWDFTDRGEGLRNTITLEGRAGVGQGPVHWTGNFDEVQDFENDIRNHFGGSGFMSDDAFFEETRSDPLGTTKAGLSQKLDALAAYVSSLDVFPKSPHRNSDGSLTDAALAGKRIFESIGCTSCHGGPALTDSRTRALHDVGTLSASSGSRLGEQLAGLDTPTLRGLWATAPYLHDGSAPTLHDVLDNPKHGAATELSPSERDQLVRFLLELEESGDTVGPAPPSSGLHATGGCACRNASAAANAPASFAWLAALLFITGRRRLTRAQGSQTTPTRSPPRTKFARGRSPLGT